MISDERFQPFPPPHATLTLSVPARPEALGIVRLVLMSCGAAAGVDIDGIFARSQDVAAAFTNVLITQPEVRRIVVRTQSGADDVDLVAVGESTPRP